MLGLLGLNKRPVSPPAQVDVDIAEEHARLAKKHGCHSAKPATQQLPAILIEAGIQAYPRDKVERWMDKKGYWAWHPLRGSDQDWMKENIGLASRMFRRATDTSYPSLYGPVAPNSGYMQLVPLPVLMTVDRLSERPDGEDLVFAVAALSDNPDPFLSVGLRSSPEDGIYVIERWDEPGFRS